MASEEEEMVRSKVSEIDTYKMAGVWYVDGLNMEGGRAGDGRLQLGRGDTKSEAFFIASAHPSVSRIPAPQQPPDWQEAMRSELEAKDAEIRAWATCGMVELMMANPNADSFVREKESLITTLRQQIATAEQEGIRKALEAVRHTTQPFDCGMIYAADAEANIRALLSPAVEEGGKA